MTIMGDSALRSALERNDIVIDPAPDDIKAASIDFRLGREALLGTGEDVLNLEEKRLLIIPPGELVLVSVLERVELGPRHAGHIGLRSAFARKGLPLLAGPQIDPGFRGRLHVALVNLSPTEVSIGYRDPLVTIVFHDLGSDVDEPYGSRPGDDYHEQDGITPQEIEDIRQHRGYALSEVIRDMQSISQNVGELKTSVQTYIRWSNVYMGIFVATIVALVATVISALLT